MTKHLLHMVSPKWYSVLLCFSLIALHSATANSEVIGKLSGEMSVNQGSLSYQLPLGVPAGIHGMKPTLSLGYSQQGLNGSVGPGFSLSASSGITRCTPNKLNDGFEAAIQVDKLSRFCHDGQRLIAISGEDGKSGTEYRTYDNSNVKYTSNGGSNHTPTSWTVQIPNGNTLTFERKGSLEQDQFAIWFLTSSSDIFSNSITYNYTDTDVAVLDSITYSGYEIDFQYNDKLAVIGQYQAGKYISANKLLDKIVVTSPKSDLLFFYDFTYEFIPGSETAKRLQNVTQCFGYSASDCLKPVEFGYQAIPDPKGTDDQITVIDKSEYGTTQGVDETPMDERPAFTAADVNGDGFEDFCYYKPQVGIQCAVFDSSGYGSPASWSDDLGYKSDAQAKKDGEGEDAGDYKAYGALSLQDLNADGKADFCITDEEGVRCGLSNGSRFYTDSYWTKSITNKHSQTLLQRINDDEFLDVCGYDSNLQYHCYAGSANGFSTKLNTFTEPDFVKKTSWMFQSVYECASPGGQCYATTQHEYEINYPSATWVDIDGDYDQDLCWVSDTQYDSKRGFTCKYASTDPRTNELSYSSPKVLIDLTSSTSAFVKPSSAIVTSQVEQQTIILANDAASRQAKALTSSFQYANLNGDSLVDICYVVANELQCRVNTGAGFLDAKSWLKIDSLLSAYSGNEREEEQRNAKISAFRFVDRNLDGRSDLCVIHAETEQCAYNTGNEFQDFKERLKIFPDIVLDDDVVKAWTSFMHKIFGGHRVHFRFQTVRAAYGNLIEVGDLNGDGYSELCYRSTSGVVCSTNDNFGPSALLTKVTDSYGLSTQVTYKNLLLDDLYDAAESVPTGFIERPNNTRVVASLKTDMATVKGIDNAVYTKQIDYRYGGFLINPVEGIGGFTQVSEIQADRNVKSVTKFYIEEDDNKLFGQQKESFQYINGVLVKEQHNSFRVEELGNGTRRLVLDKTQSKQNDLAGKGISTHTTTNEQLDDYGRPQRITLTKTHGTETLTTVTQSTYENDTSNWILGRATNQTVTHTQLGETVTRTVDFIYTDGVLTEETIQKGADNAVTMKYSDFTGTGYPQRVETSGIASSGGTTQTRFVTKTYDELGRVSTQTNALNQTITYDYHAKCGAIEYVTDIAGRKTKTSYNDQCVKTSVEAPDDNQTSWKYEWATADDNSALNRPTTTLENEDQSYDYYNPVVYKITETQKSPSTLGDFWTTVYYDAQGRAVRTQSTGFSSATIKQHVNTAAVYNQYGYKTAQSRPYFSYENGLSTSIYWITMAYDATGRPKTESKIGPDGEPLIVNYEYTGTSTTIKYSDYGKKTVNGIHGKPKSVTENGLTIEYEYNAIGDLHITRNGDLETVVNYDSRGFKANQTDPSMGYWQYKHNAFGELVYQKDAKNQVTTYNFDVLGRKDTRTAKEGVTSWQYHTSGNGKGQPYTESGVAADKKWQYDSQGRVSSETLTVNGKTFTTGYKYNSFSQLTETVQPNGVSVFHKYDNIGKLQNVSLLASDFNDVDFELLASQKSGLEAKIARLRGLQTQALAKAEYHQKKAVEYHNQYTYFVAQLEKVTEEVAVLNKDAQDHKDAADRYLRLYKDLAKKAADLRAQYGGKTFKYDANLGDDEYYYYTNTYCVSYHGWGLSRYCAEYKPNTVPVLKSDMPGTPATFINPANFYLDKAAVNEQSFLDENYKYNTLVGTSTTSAVADMTTADVQAAIDARLKQISDLEVLFAIKRQSLVSELNNKISTKCSASALRQADQSGGFYGVSGGALARMACDFMELDLSALQSIVLENPGCNATLLFNSVNTSALNTLCQQAIKPRIEIDTYKGNPLGPFYKYVERTDVVEGLVPIMMDGITIMIPAPVNHTYIAKEDISANDALVYYKAQRDQNYADMAKAIADAQAEMDTLNDESITEQLMAAEDSLALVEEKIGIIDADSLDSLLTSQASLATTQGKLTIWHAANRTAEGHLQTELFGNGLYTHREINNETGLVSNIRTGVVLGSNIRDLEYTYDARGRIVSKIDSSAHKDGTFDIRTKESFEYLDDQGRLSNWNLSQTINVYNPVDQTTSTAERDNQLDHAYEHDDVGNLTYKASAGTMEYSSTTNRLESRTHNGETTSYTYDENGNLKTGDGRSYEWTSFNKAESVSKGGQTVNFTYDASHKRTMKQTANEIRYYVNPGYERIERTTNGSIEIIHRYTVFHENDQVAVFEKTETSTQSEDEQAKYADSISYVHRDILGSGEVITDSRMNILARNFFSPYGEKVDDLLKAQAQVAGETYQAAKLGTGMIQSESDDLGADLWAEYEQAGEGDEFLSRFTAGASALDLTGVRGFTSHEAIEEIGLINMNARLYDPVIGRFMSADSIVPDLYTPLDHNRYSYVRGNPVIARDPTGHFVEVAVAAAIFAWAHYGDNPTLQMASTVLLSVAMMNPSTTPFAAGANATANAAVHSGLTSLTISFLKTGKIDRKSMENAGIAAVSAGLTYQIAHGWIGEKAGLTTGNYQWAKVTAAHMLTQGAISDLRGDKFIHGAIAGLVAKSSERLTKGLGTYDGAVVVATLSGVAAEATGGDFAQGAMTGAIIHLYNFGGNDDNKNNVDTNSVNSCSGELSCRAKDTAGPYEINESGDKRKWVEYKCYCAEDKTRFEFLGPTKTWGEPYNAYGVDQVSTIDNWGNWSVRQIINQFTVDPNINTESWYSDILYKTDFIDAFKVNNQNVP